MPQKHNQKGKYHTIKPNKNGKTNGHTQVMKLFLVRTKVCPEQACSNVILSFIKCTEFCVIKLCLFQFICIHIACDFMTCVWPFVFPFLFGLIVWYLPFWLCFCGIWYDYICAFVCMIIAAICWWLRVWFDWLFWWSHFNSAIPCWISLVYLWLWLAG